MKLHFDDPTIRSHLYEGCFGLEKESLRVDRTTGQFSRRCHPFAHPDIVQDFAENQTEINTGIYSTWKEARERCAMLTIAMQYYLGQMGEVLWPFSNPAPILSEQDIPMMVSGTAEARAYRQYLSNRYGKVKMVYSGIHYNFSFSRNLLQAQFERQKEWSDWRLFTDAFYLDLVQKVIRKGWIINVLLNASPLFDGSLFAYGEAGQSGYAGMSSMRNSELGYWNFFVPVLSYASMEEYARSIEGCVHRQLLKAPRELYYPVRLKPSGAYSLEALRTRGVSHIELRMIDLNPYEQSGISEDDAWFCHLFLVYLACIDMAPLDVSEQINAVQNFKNASRFELDHVRILVKEGRCLDVTRAAIGFLEEMEQFFAHLGDDKALMMLERQKHKLSDPVHNRLAWKVRRDFPHFARDGLAQAISLQQTASELYAGHEQWFHHAEFMPDQFLSCIPSDRPTVPIEFSED